MSDVDLLEDPEGAPYPASVQEFVQAYQPRHLAQGALFRGALVAALEAVAEHWRAEGALAEAYDHHDDLAGPRG